ncbi:MAG: hypothetical protein AB1758_04785 [Candidatus Eremiobacterota bacterium]
MVIAQLPSASLGWHRPISAAGSGPDTVTLGRTPDLEQDLRIALRDLRGRLGHTSEVGLVERLTSGTTHFFDHPHRLLAHLLPEGVRNAAYFGSGSDAEGLMLVANPDHGWLFDRIPLFAPGYGWGWYRPQASMREMVRRLQEGLDSGAIGPKSHGFFHPEGEHGRDLGVQLLASMLSAGATDLRLDPVGEHRLDVHYRWRHPAEEEPRDRLLSYVWSQDPDAKMDPAVTLEGVRAMPPLDFLMTRALNSSGRMPVLEALADHLRKDGVAYIERAHEVLPQRRGLAEVPLPPGAVPGQWSGHGTELSVLRKG